MQASQARTPNVKTFHKGQVIFKEGQDSSVAYMIRTGSVVVQRMVDNRQVVLDRLGEGQIFGEMGVLLGSKRTVTAEAAEYCELMVLTESMLRGFIAKCPKTVQHLVLSLVERLERTTSLIPDRTHQSTFVSLCNLLDLAWKTLPPEQPAERRRGGNDQPDGRSLPFRQFQKLAKSIILVTTEEIEAAFEKLALVKALEVQTLPNGERVIRLPRPETFLEVAGGLYEELKKSERGMTQEPDFCDLYDFATAVGTEPDILYKKMAYGEVPESFFFFHKARALDWAEKKGRDFFLKARRPKKALAELSEVDDVVHVDNASLKKAFESLGYYKLGVLVALAGEEAKARILSNLSAKIASIVAAEAAGKGNVDASEAEDIQEELFETVRRLKGQG